MLPADPFQLTATADRASLWRAPALVLAVALLLTALLLVSVSRSTAARERSDFEAEAARMADAIQERIDTTVTLLHGTAGLFAASISVERSEFAAYIAHLGLRARYPGVQGIGYSARIRASELERELGRIRADGAPEFVPWPDTPRDEYHSIVYLQPLDERNITAIGFDMFTEPTRRAAMERARDEGRPAASGKVTLVQEIDQHKQSGFLIYLPIYRMRSVPPDVASRREGLAGFVYAPMRVGDLLRDVRGAASRGVDYALYDGPEAVPSALLRSTGESAGRVAHQLDRHVEVAGRKWLLRLTSRPSEGLSSHQQHLLPLLVVVSLLTSLLLAWITFIQARARRDAEQAAAQRRLNELALQASQDRERERAQRLEELYAEQRDADRRKDEFLAVLAHELRNPLAPLRTALEIIRRAPDSEVAQRSREVAERQVRHMVRLIDDLLDVSRISRGNISLRLQLTRVADVIQLAVETSRPLIEARQHQLNLGEVDPELWLHVDPTRVAQVLTNLLNNAAHYTPPGGLIDVVTRVEEGTVRIAVRDNGIGIDSEHLQQVFDLFVQLDRGPGGSGLGIGLSLAARLAELHGGSLEAHSEGAGRGSEFVLVLPAVQPSAFESLPAS